MKSMLVLLVKGLVSCILSFFIIDILWRCSIPLDDYILARYQLKRSSINTNTNTNTSMHPMKPSIMPRAIVIIPFG